MDDVIRLIKITEGERDQYGNPSITRTTRQVFCRVDSVTRSEFYQAAQTELHPSYVFILSHFMDYENEREIEYTDWMGNTHRYDVIRTYRNGDELEIVTEERINDTDD